VTCKHCQDTIRIITADESLSRMVTVQAKEMRRLRAANKLKDHEIRELVDSITSAVKKVCLKSPQSLRETIARVVKQKIKG